MGAVDAMWPKRKDTCVPSQTYGRSFAVPSAIVAISALIHSMSYLVMILLRLESMTVLDRCRSQPRMTPSISKT